MLAASRLSVAAVAAHVQMAQRAHMARHPLSHSTDGAEIASHSTDGAEIASHSTDYLRSPALPGPAAAAASPPSPPELKLAAATGREAAAASPWPPAAAAPGHRQHRPQVTGPAATVRRPALPRSGAAAAGS